jgi:hypothetical protein
VGTSMEDWLALSATPAPLAHRRLGPAGPVPSGSGTTLMLALDSVMFSAWKRKPTNTPKAGFTTINVSNAVQMAATRAVVRVKVLRATRILRASVPTPNTFAASIIMYLCFNVVAPSCRLARRSLQNTLLRGEIKEAPPL